MKNLKYLMFVLGALFVLAACNKGSEITGPVKPVITLENPSRVYSVKVGRSITIAPTVTGAEGAAYSWTLENGTVIGSGATLTHTFNDKGQYFIKFRVTTGAGYDEEELRVDVGDLELPFITFAIEEGKLQLARNQTYKFEPNVDNAEGAGYVWTLDGEEVQSGADPVAAVYEFRSAVPGTFTVELTVTNADGRQSARIEVTVVEVLPIGIGLHPSVTTADPLKRTVSEGRLLVIDPAVTNAANPVYRWFIDGVAQPGGTAKTFEGSFTASPTPYLVRLEVSDPIDGGGINTAAVTVEVTCYGDETTLLAARPLSGQAKFNKIYEYLPAPGQFINDPQSGSDGITDMAAACLYAEQRMNAAPSPLYVSLGGFGGYIVAGFDHRIEARGAGPQGGDFSISGNQFDGSSEPGIVWVMQDVNGNGLPDDEWYELRGSEDEPGGTGVTRDYAMTYYRPAGATGVTKALWNDNRGRSGTINRIGMHTQDYYYPSWAPLSGYTLYGSLLEHSAYQEQGGMNWINAAFGWGYADNSGSDRESGENAEAGAQKVYFRISNAIYPDGTAAKLKFIDFIKVQSATNMQVGALGEVSTEVLGFEDENI